MVRSSDHARAPSIGTKRCPGTVGLQKSGECRGLIRNNGRWNEEANGNRSQNGGQVRLLHVVSDWKGAGVDQSRRCQGRQLIHVVLGTINSQTICRSMLNRNLLGSALALVMSRNSFSRSRTTGEPMYVDKPRNNNTPVWAPVQGGPHYHNIQRIIVDFPFVPIHSLVNVSDTRSACFEVFQQYTRTNAATVSLLPHG